MARYSQTATATVRRATGSAAFRPGASPPRSFTMICKVHAATEADEFAPAVFALVPRAFPVYFRCFVFGPIYA